MNAVQHTHTNTVTMCVMWLAVALALFAALSYLLIQLGMLGVGDLQTAGAPTIPLVAAGCYLIGGLLILVHRRWLWIVGAVINAFVILIFFMAYLNRPLVMFSAGWTGYQDCTITVGRMPTLPHRDRLAQCSSPGGLICEILCRLAERRAFMKTSRIVVWLSLLIAILAFVAAGIGLFYQDGGSSYSFTTLHGQSVQIYGQGLYRYDIPITAVGFRAADAITLVLALPLLFLSLVLYQSGKLRGGLLLAGVLAYFLYNYGSMAFGAAYNTLFLVYIILFSASLFALVLLLTSFDVPELPIHFAAGLPRRSMGIFLIVSGVILSLVWLALSIVPALLSSTAPLEVARYTTFITGVVDIGIVSPVLIVSGTLLLRNAPISYLLASTMLVFTVTLGTSLLMSGIAQLLTGVVTIGQFIGFTVPFVILTLVAFWLTVIFFRQCSDEATGQSVRMQTSHA